MKTKRTRRDVNHTLVQNELLALGFSVEDTSSFGGGFPDMVVGIVGLTFLLELKRSSTSLLNSRQVKWHNEWRGHVVVTYSTEDFLNKLASWAKGNRFVSEKFVKLIEMKRGSYEAKSNSI